MAAESASAAPSPCYDVFLARQPIFDGTGQLVAYELLYRRTADIDRADESSREVMAAEVLVNSSREAYEACRKCGYTYFQGYFFQRPETLVRSELSSRQLAILQLLNLLRDADTADRRIEDAFRGDVSLTYKLLRTVNSAATGGRNIESIGHAVRLVGRKDLHKWLSLLLARSGRTRRRCRWWRATSARRGAWCRPRHRR